MTSTLHASRVEVEEEEEGAKANAGLVETEPRGDDDKGKQCSK